MAHPSNVHAHLFVIAGPSKRWTLWWLVFLFAKRLEALLFKHRTALHRILHIILDLILENLALFWLLLHLLRIHKWRKLFDLLGLKFAVYLLVRSCIVPIHLGFTLLYFFKLYDLDITESGPPLTCAWSVILSRIFLHEQFLLYLTHLEAFVFLVNRFATALRGRWIEIDIVPVAIVASYVLLNQRIRAAAVLTFASPWMLRIRILG